MEAVLDVGDGARVGSGHFLDGVRWGCFVKRSSNFRVFIYLDWWMI